jgi:hypothetical protein
MVLEMELSNPMDLFKVEVVMMIDESVDPGQELCSSAGCSANVVDARSFARSSEIDPTITLPAQRVAAWQERQGKGCRHVT